MKATVSDQKNFDLLTIKAVLTNPKSNFNLFSDLRIALERMWNSKTPS